MIVTRVSLFILFLAVCFPCFSQEALEDSFYDAALENQEVLILEVHTLNLTLSDLQAQNLETASNVESIKGAVAFVLIASALSFGSLLFISYSQRR